MDLLPATKNSALHMRRECRERFPRHRLQRKTQITLVSQIEEHTEKDEEIAEHLIVAHLFHAISIATNNRTPGIFSTALIVKRVWLLGTPG